MRFYKFSPLHPTNAVRIRRDPEGRGAVEYYSTPRLKIHSALFIQFLASAKLFVLQTLVPADFEFYRREFFEFFVF